MKSDRRKWRTSADGPECEAACPNFVHLYILVVNKSLSVEVPCSDSSHVTAPYKLSLYYYYYTGRFWLHNATEQITRQLKWVTQRQVEQQQQQTTTRARSRQYVYDVTLTKRHSMNMASVNTIPVRMTSLSPLVKSAEPVDWSSSTIQKKRKNCIREIDLTVWNYSRISSFKHSQLHYITLKVKIKAT